LSSCRKCTKPMHLCLLISILKISGYFIYLLQVLIFRLYLPFTSFDIQKFYVLAKECVNASGVHIRISSDYFAMQYSLMGFLT